MPPQIGALIIGIGILGLFWLDRDPGARTSKALWIPTVWLLINGSRPVSQWLEAAGWNTGPPINSTDLYLDGSPIDRNVFAVLLFAALVVLVSRRHVVGSLLHENGLILLFFSYCAISILWSDYPFVTFKHWTKGMGDLAMVLVVLTDPDPKLAFKRLLTRAGFLLVPLSVLLIKYYPELGQGYNHWTWIQEYVGVSTTKNMLGMICLICGIASVWRFEAVWRDRGGLHRTQRLIAHGALLAMVLWLFSLAHSMTSLSCFLMATSLIVTTSLPVLRRKPSAVHILVAATVGVAFFALFMDPGGGLVESLGKDPTLTGRTQIWNLVLGLHANPLVGTGYESFWLGDRLQQVWNVYPGIQEAHDGYLEMYLNLGFIGLALLLVIIAAGYHKAITRFYHDANWGKLSLAYFVIAVIYSFTEAGFRMLCPIWIVFLLVTVATPLVTESSLSDNEHLRDNSAECESRVDPAVGIRIHWEAN